MAKPNSWIDWEIGTTAFAYNCAISYGGTFILSIGKYAGNPAVEFANPMRHGYVFGGRYENSDFSGAQYENLQTAPNKTLYAKWIAE